MDLPVLPLSLEEGLARYKASKVQPKGFNLFCSMFNWHNERYLHSSFIGMMLSMKREFLVSFLEELHRADEGVFTDEDLAYFEGCACEVHPNMNDHREWNNIDLLIRTADGKRAVVIENKMLANDRMVDDMHQLEAYMCRVQKDNAERVIGVYLSPRRYLPDFGARGTERNLMTLGYDTSIKQWVEACLKQETDGFKREMIRQYGELLDVALNDPQTAIAFREVVAANREAAYELYCRKDADRDFMEAMEHVKWHTLYDVLNGVFDGLKGLEGVEWNVENDREMQKDVDRVARTDRSTSLLVYDFYFKKERWYICNDAKGFTMERCGNNANYTTLEGTDIRSFKQPGAFRLVNRECREGLVKELMKEIKKKLGLQDKDLTV